MRYHVQLSFTGYCEYEVEAVNEQAAVLVAEDKYNSGEAGNWGEQERWPEADMVEQADEAEAAGEADEADAGSVKKAGIALAACCEGGNTMKHKVGSTVRIRAKEWMDTQEKNGNGSILGPEAYDYVMSKPMQEYAGKVAVIMKAEEGCYEIDVDSCDYCWEDWMFESDDEAETAGGADEIGGTE